jgi:hypothetical protein
MLSGRQLTEVWWQGYDPPESSSRSKSRDRIEQLTGLGYRRDEELLGQSSGVGTLEENGIAPGHGSTMDAKEFAQFYEVGITSASLTHEPRPTIMRSHLAPGDEAPSREIIQVMN